MMKIKYLPERWSVKKIGDFSKTFSGGTPPTDKPEYFGGNIPWIRSGDLNQYEIKQVDIFITDNAVKNSSAKIVEAETLLLALYGATAGISAITKIRGAINQAILAFILDDKQIEKLYLFQWFNANKDKIIYEYTQGGQPNLNAELVKFQNIILPPLPEQKKIAEILSTWDEAIQTTQSLIKKLEIRKKGLMQRLMSGEGKSWKISNMSEIFERVRRNTKGSNEIPILTISAKQGFLSQNEKFNRVIAGTSLEKYVLLKQNEFSYNKGNSKTFPFGCIYKLQIKEGLVPNVYISFRAKMDISEDFYQHYFLFGSIDSQLKGIISSGARADGLLNVAWEEFFKLKVCYPPIEEQIAIAKILNTADAEINETKAYLAALKQQKKGLMQQLLTGKIRVKTIIDI